MSPYDMCKYIIENTKMSKDKIKEYINNFKEINVITKEEYNILIDKISNEIDNSNI